MKIDLQTRHARVARVLKRLRCWLALALLGAVFWWVPLGSYLWDMGTTLVQYGVSRQAWPEYGRHSDWLLRFFTGPPSDAEMRRFFERYRADLNRIVTLYYAEQCVFDYHPPTPFNACLPIAHKIGVKLYPKWRVLNAAGRPRYRQVCSSPCDALSFNFRERTQNWWRNTNPVITGWIKSLLYIPPLVPYPGVSGEPLTRDEVIRRECQYPRASLNTPLPEIMAEADYSDNCGYFPLGDGWYVVLYATFDIG